MADINVTCPHCNQLIACDELWAGHEMQCPTCQKPLVVPAPAAPSVASTTIGKALVPVPTGPAPRLSVGQAKAEAASAPQRSIPIRNLAPQKVKKKNPILKYVGMVAVLGALGAGGYYGYNYYLSTQEKSKAAAPAPKQAGRAPAGALDEMNATMDASDAMNGNSSTPQPRRSPRGRPGMPPMSPGPGADPNAAPPADQQPVIPAVWTMDLAKAKIPEGPANGTIGGSNFITEAAFVAPSATGAQVVRLLQGQPTAPDREVLIFLHLRSGEKIGGQTLSISPDMSGAGVPQVGKLWKTDPRYAPTVKYFSTGYAMKLTLGQMANGMMSGTIFLALPDNEHTVVAGSFQATTPEAAAQAAGMGAPAPAYPGRSPYPGRPGGPGGAPYPGAPGRYPPPR